MWMRVIGVVSVGLCFVAACGDDDSGSGFSDSCTPMMASVAGMANDPCPQNEPQCPSVTYNAVAMCDASGKWQKDAMGSIMCRCLPKGGTTMPMPAMCGNGVLEAAKGEQCEGANLMNASCMSLNMGTGVLKCDPNTCRYDTSMCMALPNVMGSMGGNGGGMGGNGN